MLAVDLDLPVPTFLCSEAVLGLSGVVFMLAGVAATGEDAFFSIISAGIFRPKKISNEGQQQRKHCILPQRAIATRKAATYSSHASQESNVSLSPARTKKILR